MVEVVIATSASSMSRPGGHPVVTVGQVAAAHGISFVAASRAVNQLVERSILAEPKRRRNRVFHALEVLERLERP